MSWWRRRTLRVRLMLLGVSGLCAGFLLGGAVLVAALGLVLQRSVDNEARHTARDVAALVDAGALPRPVPVAGSAQVQVVDAQGRIRSASIDADRLVAILRPEELLRARGGEALSVPGERLGLSGPVRVVAVAAGPPSDPQTVVVARSIVDVVRGTELLRAILLVVLPVLVVVLAAVAWRVIGATLQPVEALRRGAAEITLTAGTARPGRLPVPPRGDEIHRLAVTLNDMLDRLESARARQREFVADAAHELRSPLANLRTQLEVALRPGAAPRWTTLGEELLLDTQRLSRLVDDLLLLARVDAGVAPAIEPVELAALVRGVVARYPAAVPVLGGPLWTMGVPDELRRVLANLLDNATRHARSLVRVELSAGDGDGEVALAVTDDGPGIPACDRDRVFERFTRLDDARARDAGGAGLGLAIVRELVARNRGRVRLSDAPGGGLRAEVRLPAAAPQPAKISSIMAAHPHDRVDHEP